MIEQRLTLVAHPSHRFEITVGRGHHATLALHRLEQHRGDALVRQRLGDRVDLAELNLAEADWQWLERLLLLRLASGCERRERAAVERPVSAHHMEPLGSTVQLAVAARRA